MGQLSFSYIELGQSRKPSRVMAKLDKINEIVDWDNVLDIIKSVDKTSKKTGGAPAPRTFDKGQDAFFAAPLQP